MHHKVISDLVTRPNARLLCGCTLYYSNQKHTQCGNLYLKWCKYTVPKWKINVLKRWPVQSSSYWTRIILQDNPSVQVLLTLNISILINKQCRYNKTGTMKNFRLKTSATPPQNEYLNALDNDREIHNSTS